MLPPTRVALVHLHIFPAGLGERPQGSSGVSKLVPTTPVPMSSHAQGEQFVQRGGRASGVNATDEEVR